MAELCPMGLGALARRAIVEREHQDAIYDLPARKWFVADRSLDLSVSFHGERAATPVGPAAGPHSQLAQNIVLSWLGGGRIVELKTVQILDELELPRPCIDATNVGFNVEWSQELRVPQSLAEYAKAQMLVRILQEAGVVDEVGGRELLFDLSVGYDLAGIQSDKVTGFLRAMQDASGAIDHLRGELTGDLARFRDLDFSPHVGDCVTLSTFHGCPAGEIESICRYLLEELGLHVVVKMNPTLLGYRRVCELLHDQLGYHEIRPIAGEFDRDMQWDQALAMIDRLREVARREGRTLGAKFTNTLVVENHRGFFPAEERMYMSGPPLHPISLSLALQFREAVGPDLPISFSAGIDAQNFADAVACGMVPVTTCTDLLRPGGYGRLHKYLVNLEKRMHKLGVEDIAGFVLAAEGCEAEAREAAGPGAAEEQVLARASLLNMRKVVARVLADPRYTRAKNAAVPRKIGSHLVLFDCVSCDKCVPVCPNDANFVYTTEALSRFTEEVLLIGGQLRRRVGAPYHLEREHQLANYASFCNDCGNCDVFCPEDGGPYIEKPRFFSSLASFEVGARHGGLYVEASSDLVRVWARIAGSDYRLDLERAGGRSTLSDGAIELVLDEQAHVERATRLPGVTPTEGHVLSTAPALAILAIVRPLFDLTRPNPVNAPWLGG